MDRNEVGRKAGGPLFAILTDKREGQADAMAPQRTDEPPTPRQRRTTSSTRGKESKEGASDGAPIGDAEAQGVESLPPWHAVLSTGAIPVWSCLH